MPLVQKDPLGLSLPPPLGATRDGDAEFCIVLVPLENPVAELGKVAKLLWEEDMLELGSTLEVYVEAALAVSAAVEDELLLALAEGLTIVAEPVELGEGDEVALGQRVGSDDAERLALGVALGLELELPTRPLLAVTLALGVIVGVPVPTGLRVPRALTVAKGAVAVPVAGSGTVFVGDEECVAVRRALTLDEAVPAARLGEALALEQAVELPKDVRVEDSLGEEESENWAVRVKEGLLVALGEPVRVATVEVGEALGQPEDETELTGERDVMALAEGVEDMENVTVEEAVPVPA